MFFLLFLYNFEILHGLLYFPGEVFDSMYEDLLYDYTAIIVYHLNFLVSPSGDFNITVFLIYIIHAYLVFFEWRKRSTHYLSHY